MNYKHNYEYCLADNVGSSGLTSTEFQSSLLKAGEFIEKINDGELKNIQPLFEVVKTCDDLVALEPHVQRYQESFDNVVVLGTGGSSLGGRTLVSSAPPPRRSIGTCRLDRPKLYFFENIDPDSFDRLFQRIDLSRTGFLVISKSGSTAETMAQFILCMDVVREQFGMEGVASRFTAITEPGARPLRKMCKTHGIPVLDCDPAIGGRYSAFSLASIFPAMIADLDAKALRSGAASVANTFVNGKDITEIEPAIGSAIAVSLAQNKGATISVMMPYIDRLENFGKWYRQLWAESLGKNGQGTTPVNALGSVDQHSQLQLYIDGPADKFFTLIFSKMRDRGELLPKELIVSPQLDYLAGKRMGDLMASEQQATFESLVNNGRPTRIFEIEDLNEHSLGALMMHFMLETITAASLMDINPFDQPAVEASKDLARRIMERGTPT